MECRTLRDATGTPELNHLSPAPYVVIDSPVAPGSQELLQALSVLEQLSTLVKASRHGASEYEHYALFPLEGVWALIENDKTLTFDERVAPGKIMMRQADSVTLAEFHEHRLSLGQTIGKGHERYLNTARLVTIDEGPCVQILHLGPYNDEPASFAIIDGFPEENQLQRVSANTHREIYLVDARTAQPAASQTVLRVQVTDSPAR